MFNRIAGQVRSNELQQTTHDQQSPSTGRSMVQAVRNGALSQSTADALLQTLEQQKDRPGARELVKVVTSTLGEYRSESEKSARGQRNDFGYVSQHLEATIQRALTLFRANPGTAPGEAPTVRPNATHSINAAPRDVGLSTRASSPPPTRHAQTAGGMTSVEVDALRSQLMSGVAQTPARLVRTGARPAPRPYDPFGQGARQTEAAGAQPSAARVTVGHASTTTPLALANRPVLQRSDAQLSKSAAAAALKIDQARQPRAPTSLQTLLAALDPSNDPPVTALDLTRLRLNDREEAGQAKKALVNSQSLTSLRVGEQGLMLIKGNSKPLHERLQSLAVASDRLADLEKMPNLPALKSLTISNSSTPDTVRSFVDKVAATSRQLQHLDIGNASITRFAAQRFLNGNSLQSIEAGNAHGHDRVDTRLQLMDKFDLNPFNNPRMKFENAAPKGPQPLPIAHPVAQFTAQINSGATHIDAKDLRLQNAQDTAAVQRLLGNAKHVTSISVDHNSIGLLMDPSSTLRRRLQHLEIQGDRLPTLDRLPTFPALESLKLTTVERTQVTERFVKNIGGSSLNLKSLDIGELPMSRDAVLHFLDQKFLSAIKSGNVNAQGKRAVKSELYAYGKIDLSVPNQRALLDETKELPQYKRYVDSGGRIF